MGASMAGYADVVIARVENARIAVVVNRNLYRALPRLQGAQVGRRVVMIMDVDNRHGSDRILTLSPMI